MSGQCSLAGFSLLVARSPVGSFLVGIGPVDPSVSGGFHSSNMACISGEKGEASSSLSCVCLFVMRWLVFFGGLFDPLFPVSLFET